MKKHPILKESEYFDVKEIGCGRKDKVCEHCKKKIPIGESHLVHTFDPDPNFVPDPTKQAKAFPGIMFRSFPTHRNCSDAFLKSLQ